MHVALAAEDVTLKMEAVLEYGLNLRLGPSRHNNCNNNNNYCAGGKIEKNEMGGACGAYGGGERCAQGSGRET